MPTTDRARGGVAAATSFYGNRAAGAASEGLKQRKKEKLGSGTTSGREDRWAPLRASKSAGDLEVGFKSPRAVAQWKQRKLEMAGMVTEVKRWDDTVKPWEKKVTTPAPVQRRDFSRISPHAVQSFEQWHDRHTHLDYPHEIPDPMFYHKKGRGPLPTPKDTGAKAARAYGSRHVKKLPGLQPPRSDSRGGQGKFSLSKGMPPQPKCKTAFLNAMFQDVGSGDGSWMYANPRALQWLPHELLRTEQYYHLTSTLTNLHFLLKKTQECGIASVRWDLQQATSAFQQLFRSGSCQEQGIPMETVLDWQARVNAFRIFIDANVGELAALPVTIFRLGAATPAGSHVYNDVQSAVMQAEHSISIVHNLLDPLQSSDADTVNNIPRLLTARQFLEVVRQHGIWLAMDSTALDRIATAEKRADEHIFHFRDRLQEVPEAIDRVGQVLLRGPAGQSEHWEKDLSFYSLTQLFGENFFSYEPQQAFACFRVVEASEEEDQRQRNGLLLEQLSEETGLPQDCLELIVDGVDSVLKMTAPEQEGEASFDMAPVRTVAQRIMQDACDPESDLRRAGLVIGGAPPPQVWREACIYITSTIADMQPERDMLSRFVLPALKLACRRRRLRLSWVMCGVQAPADLSKNLTWVERSTLSLPNGQRVPFSLAILGSKRGWIPGEDVRVEAVRRNAANSWVLDPPFKNWSLNQLEICHAQLRAKDARGFIFLRDPSFVDSEAFQQSPLQVQDIFVERSLEANSLSEDFKMHVSNHNHRSCQREDRIFEYKTVFVDGEVQDGTGPGVRVAFAGLFSFGLDVYTSLFKMIDSVFPTCMSTQPELSSVTAETQNAREDQLRLHASSVVVGTRSLFISQICNLLLESQDDILVAVNGPTGSGRTCIMANIIVRALQEQARRAASEAPERKQNFVCAWVIHEPWQTEFDWVHCLASQVCQRAAGKAAEEYVGDTSVQSILNAIWDMMTRNAEWFGDLDKKAALGRLKIAISTDGFNSEMHRRVQIIDVPRLELEERLRICWSYILENKSQIPTKVFERICASKIGAAYPRYLKTAMNFLSACQQVFPGQLDLITKEMGKDLYTLYEHDVLPFLEDQGDKEAVKETLSSLLNSKGLLPCEVKWVLQEAGQPGDDGRVADVVDILQPYRSAHRRADELLCLGCSILRLCIARRYNLEIKEIPLHYSAKKVAKAEAAAQNRLGHRRLLAEMEAKAGFKSQTTAQKAADQKKVVAPTAIGRDMERDKDLDEAAIQVVSAAIWDARQDLYSDTLVRNARLATLEREKEKERGRVH